MSALAILTKCPLAKCPLAKCHGFFRYHSCHSSAIGEWLVEQNSYPEDYFSYI